jgi:hypothetical protein
VRSAARQVSLATRQHLVALDVSKGAEGDIPVVAVNEVRGCCAGWLLCCVLFCRVLLCRVVRVHACRHGWHLRARMPPRRRRRSTRAQLDA